MRNYSLSAGGPARRELRSYGLRRMMLETCAQEPHPAGPRRISFRSSRDEAPPNVRFRSNGQPLQARSANLLPSVGTALTHPKDIGPFHPYLKIRGHERAIFWKRGHKEAGREIASRTRPPDKLTAFSRAFADAAFARIYDLLSSFWPFQNKQPPWENQESGLARTAGARLPGWEATGGFGSHTARPGGGLLVAATKTETSKPQQPDLRSLAK